MKVETKVRVGFDSAVILCILVLGTLFFLVIQYMLIKGVQLCARF